MVASSTTSQRERDLALSLSLKVEPTSPGRLGQRLDAPVVDVAPAVERYGLDVGRLAELGDLRADELGGALVPARRAAELLPDLRGQRGGGGEGGAGGVVDDLGVDVVVGAEDGEARPLGLALELEEGEEEERKKKRKKNGFV